VAELIVVAEFSVVAESEFTVATADKRCDHPRGMLLDHPRGMLLDHPRGMLLDRTHSHFNPNTIVGSNGILERKTLFKNEHRAGDRLKL
jgi:hypothetical protein